MRSVLPRSFAIILVLTQLTRAPLAGQSLDAAGIVRDSTGKGIEGVAILAVGASRRSATDAQGRFVIRGLNPGRTTIEARAIGYSVATVVVDVEQDAAPIEITLVAAPTMLPRLDVNARITKPSKYAATTKYDDFFRRQRSGFGTFVDREEIVRRNAFHTYEILRDIPGVKVNSVSGDPLSARITFPRCSGGRANVVVYVDGTRQVPQAASNSLSGNDAASSRPGRGQNPLETMAGTTSERRGQGSAIAEMLSRISAPQIEMIEVYRGVSEIPGELNEDACAVIFIWSRWDPTQ